MWNVVFSFLLKNIKRAAAKNFPVNWVSFSEIIVTRIPYGVIQFSKNPCAINISVVFFSDTVLVCFAYLSVMNMTCSFRFEFFGKVRIRYIIIGSNGPSAVNRRIIFCWRCFVPRLAVREVRSFNTWKNVLAMLGKQNIFLISTNILLPPEWLTVTISVIVWKFPIGGDNSRNFIAHSHLDRCTEAP